MMHSSRGHGSAIAREHSLQSLTPEEQSAAATAGGAEAAGEDVVSDGGGRAVAAVGGGLGGRKEGRDDRRRWIETRRHDQVVATANGCVAGVVPLLIEGGGLELLAALAPGLQ
jgi:hypothetical protein